MRWLYETDCAARERAAFFGCHDGLIIYSLYDVCVMKEVKSFLTLLTKLVGFM